MHVEMSLDQEVVEPVGKRKEAPESLVSSSPESSASGSQVVSSQGRTCSNNQNQHGQQHVILTATAAVLSVSSLYLVFVLVL